MNPESQDIARLPAASRDLIRKWYQVFGARPPITRECDVARFVFSRVFSTSPAVREDDGDQPPQAEVPHRGAMVTALRCRSQSEPQRFRVGDHGTAVLHVERVQDHGTALAALDNRRVGSSSQNTARRFPVSRAADKKKLGSRSEARKVTVNTAWRRRSSRGHFGDSPRKAVTEMRNCDGGLDGT